MDRCRVRHNLNTNAVIYGFEYGKVKVLKSILFYRFPFDIVTQKLYNIPLKCKAPTCGNFVTRAPYNIMTKRGTQLIR